MGRRALSYLPCSRALSRLRALLAVTRQRRYYFRVKIILMTPLEHLQLQVERYNNHVRNGFFRLYSSIQTRAQDTLSAAAVESRFDSLNSPNSPQPWNPGNQLPPLLRKEY